MKLKLISTFIFCLLLVPFVGLRAETLNFIPGSKARFHIIENANVKVESMVDAEEHCKVEAIVDITLMAPDTIEMSIHELHVDMERTNGMLPDHVASLHFNSKNASEEQKTLSELLHTPMVFKKEEGFVISGDFRPLTEASAYVRSITGFDEQRLFAVSEEGMARFLTHLFHLEGKELKSARTYKQACMQNENGAVSVAYKIGKIKDGQIKARMDVKLKAAKKSDITLKVSGSALWDISNSLIQKRAFEFNGAGKRGPANYSLHYQLNWKSEALAP